MGRACVVEGNAFGDERTLKGGLALEGEVMEREEDGEWLGKEAMSDSSER